MTKIQEMIERYKILAELYLKENRRIFIRDISDAYYFADILFVGETRLYIQCFAPESKIGQKVEILWPTIVKLEEYAEVGDE